VEDCTQCGYPVKPEDAERLRENLDKLDALRKEKVLSDSECSIRRQMIIGLYPNTGQSPGEGYHTAAWVVGLPGVVLAGSGRWLAQRADPVLWTIIAVSGGVMIALGIAFAFVASSKRRKEKDDAASPSSREAEPRRMR
jgi:hypothetical protein